MGEAVVYIDRVAFQRPKPCTTRVLLALVGKSTETHDLYETYIYEGARRDVFYGKDEEMRGTVFHTFPKAVNGG